MTTVDISWKLRAQKAEAHVRLLTKCADCQQPLGDVFAVDFDDRCFHPGTCGGAEFAKRMSGVEGSPEYSRMLAAKLASAEKEIAELRAKLEYCSKHHMEAGD